MKQEQKELIEMLLKSGKVQIDQLSVGDHNTMNHYSKEMHGETKAPHFPLNKPEEEGRRLYELLMLEHFMARDTELDCWLYTMGYSTQQPVEWKPIGWLKNVQLAQELLRGIHGNLIETKELTVQGMTDLAEQCFVKDGKPLKLAKYKAEPSVDSDVLQKFFRPNPTS